MQSKGSTYLIDWLAVTLRWMFLIGFVISIAIGGDLSAELMVVILSASIWNVVLTILVALRRRIVAHPYLSVLGDVVITVLLFVIGAAFGGHIAWVGLLPVTTAALYFYVAGAFILSIGIIIIQGAVALLFSTLPIAGVYLGALTPLVYLMGTVYNFCSEHQSLRLKLSVGSRGYRWVQRTPAMAAGITDHCWSVKELLLFQVPLPAWTPPKHRGRRSAADIALIQRWCS